MPEDEFDFDAFDAEFEAEQAEQLPEGDENLETEGDLVETDEVVGDDLPLADNSEEPTPPSRDEDRQKHDTAFAQLRRERDEALAVNTWLEQMAHENGTTVEEMQQRYADAQLQRESQATGVPVDVLQRLTSLEQENNYMKEQSYTERFNSQVEQTINKYQASNEEVEQAFAYAHQAGLVDALKSGTTNFEAVYKMAHLDSLIEKQTQSALQNNLSQKRKRQQEAPIGNGGSASSSDDTDDLALNDAKAILAGGGF